MYPRSTPFLNTYQTRGLFSIPFGTTIDAMTPLHPFYTSDGGFWNPTSTRLISAFGYTYPELPDHANQDELRRSAIEAVNRLYGPFRQGPLTSGSASIPVRGVNGSPLDPSRGNASPLDPSRGNASPLDRSPGNASPGIASSSSSNPTPVMGTTDANPADADARAEPDVSDSDENAASLLQPQDAQAFSQPSFSNSVSLSPVRSFLSPGSRLGGTKEYFIIISVLREHLPLPCCIEIYLDNQLAGSVTYLEMPAAGESYAEVPVPNSLQSTLDALALGNHMLVLPKNRFTIKVVKVGLLNLHFPLHQKYGPL